MKKITILFMAVLLVGLGACGKSNEATKESKIEIKTNDVYEVPLRPTDYQATLYNELTKALEGTDDEAIAKLVAQNFSADFFTLKNKESAEEVGGITYLPTSRQEEFKTFAMNYVYANFQLIKDDYGKSSLPEVKEVKVDTIEAQTISYTLTIPADEANGIEESQSTEDFEGYIVKVSILYEETKVPSSELKTTATFSIVKVDNRWVIVKMD